MVLCKRGERLYSGLEQVLRDHLVEKVRYILVFSLFFFQLSL